MKVAMNTEVPGSSVARRNGQPGGFGRFLVMQAPWVVCSEGLVGDWLPAAGIADGRSAPPRSARLPLGFPRERIDVEDSHRAAACCHLGNIAYHTRRTIRWDGESEQILDDEEAATLLSRTRRRGYELPSV